MSSTPEVSKTVHDELEDLASKHSYWNTFQEDVLRLADVVWHNVRGRGDQKPVEDSSDEQPVNEGSEEPVDSGETSVPDGVELVTPGSPDIEPAKDETPAPSEPAQPSVVPVSQS